MYNYLYDKACYNYRTERRPRLCYCQPCDSKVTIPLHDEAPWPTVPLCTFDPRLNAARDLVYTLWVLCSGAELARLEESELRPVNRSCHRLITNPHTRTKESFLLALMQCIKLYELRGYLNSALLDQRSPFT